MCTAVQQQSRVRACDLIPTCHTAGAALSCCRPPISKGHPKSVVCSRSYVRPVRCCSALWSLVLCSSTLRVSQAAKAFFFFNKLVATGLVFRYFRMLWHEKIFVGDVGLLSPSMIGCSPKGFFLSYRPRDIYLAFLASKTNQLPPLTVVSCRKRQQSSSISVVTTCTPLSSTVVFAFMC